MPSWRPTTANEMAMAKERSAPSEENKKGMHVTLGQSQTDRQQPIAKIYSHDNSSAVRILFQSPRVNSVKQAIILMSSMMLCYQKYQLHLQIMPLDILSLMPAAFPPEPSLSVLEP